ncbi:unnamed protein product, partial [Protopolystoma xenopodis]
MQVATPSLQPRLLPQRLAIRPSLLPVTILPSPMQALASKGRVSDLTRPSYGLTSLSSTSSSALTSSATATLLMPPADAGTTVPSGLPSGGLSNRFVSILPTSDAGNNTIGSASDSPFLGRTASSTVLVGARCAGQQSLGVTTGLLSPTARILARPSNNLGSSGKVVQSSLFSPAFSSICTPATTVPNANSASATLSIGSNSIPGTSGLLPRLIGLPSDTSGSIPGTSFRLIRPMQTSPLLTSSRQPNLSHQMVNNAPPATVNLTGHSTSVSSFKQTSEILGLNNSQAIQSSGTYTPALSVSASTSASVTASSALSSPVSITCLNSESRPTTPVRIAPHSIPTVSNSPLLVSATPSRSLNMGFSQSPTLVALAPNPVSSSGATMNSLTGTTGAGQLRTCALLPDGRQLLIGAADLNTGLPTYPPNLSVKTGTPMLTPQTQLNVPRTIRNAAMPAHVLTNLNRQSCQQNQTITLLRPSVPVSLPISSAPSPSTTVFLQAPSGQTSNMTQFVQILPKPTPAPLNDRSTVKVLGTKVSLPSGRRPLSDTSTSGSNPNLMPPATSSTSMPITTTNRSAEPMTAN